tara:strand:- start:233 stop:616 length:384 start_codon:yes stop_codon:yes gene_type:complete
MNKVTNILYTDKDVGKNVYRKTTYYTLKIEEDFLADDADNAQDLSMDTGLDYSKITTNLVDDKGVSEVNVIDANYTDSEMKYVGKVVYEDTEYAKEDGDVEIDTLADEHQNEKALNDYVKEEAEASI